MIFSESLFWNHLIKRHENEKWKQAYRPGQCLDKRSCFAPLHLLPLIFSNDQKLVETWESDEKEVFGLECKKNCRGENYGRNFVQIYKKSNECPKEILLQFLTCALIIWNQTCRWKWGKEVENCFPKKVETCFFQCQRRKIGLFFTFLRKSGGRESLLSQKNKKPSKVF